MLFYAASLSVLVTVLPEIMKKGVQWWKYFNFPIKISEKKIKTRRAYFKLFPLLSFATSLQCQFTPVHMRAALPWTYLNLLGKSSNKIPAFSCGKMSVKCKGLDICLDWKSKELDLWVQEAKSYIPGMYRLARKSLRSSSTPHYKTCNHLKHGSTGNNIDFNFFQLSTDYEKPEIHLCKTQEPLLEQCSYTLCGQYRHFPIQDALFFNITERRLLNILESFKFLLQNWRFLGTPNYSSTVFKVEAHKNHAPPSLSLPSICLEQARRGQRNEEGS